MINLQVTVDTSKLDPMMKRFERRVKYATAAAMTKTVVEAQKKITADMSRVFQQPTPFTLKSTRIEPAKPEKLDASVWFKQRRSDEPQNMGHYLWPQVMGGNRAQKGFERRLERVYALPKGWVAIPGKLVALDAYGNYPLAQLNRILSYLDAFEQYAGDARNMTAAKRAKLAKGSKKSLGFEIFVMLPGRTWPSGRKAQPGIYMRVFGAGAKGGGALVPLFIYVRQATYRARLPFFSTVNQVRHQQLQGFFDAEMARISKD